MKVPLIVDKDMCHVAYRYMEAPYAMHLRYQIDAFSRYSLAQFVLQKFMLFYMFRLYLKSLSDSETPTEQYFLVYQVCAIRT